MDFSINIIAFDVPYPANYGGVIDVYYKLEWLKKMNVKIYLHCFYSTRKQSIELETLCEQVFYYKRNTSLFSNFSFLPYTVKSRQSIQLEQNLLQNKFPILFEVLHTTYILKDKRFENRLKIYRHSNIEHDYYLELSKSEKSFLKKIFLKIEAWKLKRYEKIINYSNLILAVNKKDADYFLKKFPIIKTEYLPSFHANHQLNIKSGKGNYILFHGNLSISENYNSILYLIENIISKTNFKCIVAGLNPPTFLNKLIQKYSQIELISNPNEDKMNTLIQEAHIHILHTFQPTGLKLKLLNVLFNGRFILTNPYILSGTDILGDNSIYIKNTDKSFIDSINELMTREFTPQLAEERKLILDAFSNQNNINKLIKSVFNT